MKISNLVGERFKERPSDCLADSHAIMIKGGYLKYVANGIYSSYPPLKRVTRKIEQIIREEMDKINGQEVLLPVALPAKLWVESGRYDNVGEELLRFQDRNQNEMVLGMTHEEAAVQLVREYGKSYLKYPFMIYQIQTKFRDEARPRGGLIRVREFIMKDAYSFHTSQEDLEKFYNECHKAYERIFSRTGIPETISVLSDCGMMGGNVSHEFMLLTPIGEDSIVLCENCGYKSNMEAAKNIVDNEQSDISQLLSIVHTPNMKCVEDVCEFFDCGKERICKAVVYQKQEDGEFVVVFLRGDYEVNEAKLKNYLGAEIKTAVNDVNRNLKFGFIGPYQLNANCEVLFDCSLEKTNNLVCGGNETDYHYSGLDIARDIGNVSYVDLSKVQKGGTCPVCGKQSLNIARGIEVGNIFQLGAKYTEAMGMTYFDEAGEKRYPVMGCYGIGIGRLAASVCEAHHDEYGPVWPKSIAPWLVHLCAVRVDDSEVKRIADKVYDDLQKEGIEVIYDDRCVSAGIMFADADLLGCPFRVIISPRNLKMGVCEIISRDKTINVKVDLGDVCSTIEHLLEIK